MTTLTWLTRDEATIPKSSKKEPKDVVDMQINKLNNFMAHYLNVGAPTGNKPQTLIVKREDKNGTIREMLKIAIANHTFRLLPIDDTSIRGKINLIKAVIDELPSYQDGLYETWEDARPARKGVA